MSAYQILAIGFAVVAIICAVVSQIYAAKAVRLSKIAAEKCQALHDLLSKASP